MPRKFWVYIMSSDGGTLYTGMTNNMDRRNFEHKEGVTGGFTDKYSCHRLVYFESFDDVKKAISREKVIKGWTRKRKMTLVESMNPRWEDLSRICGSKMLMKGESIAESEAKAARAKELAAASKK